MAHTTMTKNIRLTGTNPAEHAIAMAYHNTGRVGGKANAIFPWNSTSLQGSCQGLEQSLTCRNVADWNVQKAHYNLSPTVIPQSHQDAEVLLVEVVISAITKDRKLLFPMASSLL